MGSQPVGFAPRGLRASAAALAQFDELWDVLIPAERSRLVRSLIATITYEATGEVRIALNPGAIRGMTPGREGTVDQD